MNGSVENQDSKPLRKNANKTIFNVIIGKWMVDEAISWSATDLTETFCHPFFYNTEYRYMQFCAEEFYFLH